MSENNNNWHESHKKAIAEKWAQCPPIAAKIKGLIADQVCMGTYRLVELEVMQLEQQNAELKAKLEEALHTSSVRSNLVNKKTLENAELLELVEQKEKELAELKRLVVECVSWNWLDDDAQDVIPEEIADAVDKIVTELLELQPEESIKPCPAS